MPYVGGVKRLVSVVQSLSSARSLEKIIILVRSAAREIVNSDGATFVLREGDFCHYADEDAISPLWKGQRFPMDSCISGWAMKNKRAVSIVDVLEDPRIPIAAYRPTFVRSLSMVPIRKENPIGAIGVYWAKEHQTTPEELELLQALADTVSVAMENVNLYEKLEARVDDLKKANEAKDNFLLTVSHELRTPLNAILGWVELLKEGELDEGESKKALDVIERNARSQTHIVDDLIDSTRIVMGRLRMDQKELLKIQNRGPGVEVEVQDQGIGMTEEERSKVFARFHQADSTITRKYGGLGLGLSICKYLVENHGGRINVYSKGVNMGTTVVFSIPSLDKNKETVAAALEDHAKASYQPDKRLNGFHILAVDDDEDSLGLMEVVLRRSGAKVEKANSVREAIRLSRLFHFDALVSDLSMPEEDGFSLVRKVRSGETSLSREIPAVAVTAFNDKESESKALAAGFDEFFGKPFSGSKLIHTIESFGTQRDQSDSSSASL